MNRWLILIPAAELPAVRRAVERVNPGGGAGFGVPLLASGDPAAAAPSAYAACWQMTAAEAAAFTAALVAEHAGPGVRRLPTGHPDPHRSTRHPVRLLADEGWWPR